MPAMGSVIQACTGTGLGDSYLGIRGLFKVNLGDIFVCGRCPGFPGSDSKRSVRALQAISETRLSTSIQDARMHTRSDHCREDRSSKSDLASPARRFEIPCCLDLKKSR